MSGSVAGWLAVAIVGVLVSAASVLLVGGLVVVRGEVRTRERLEVDDEPLAPGAAVTRPDGRAVDADERAEERRAS